MMHGKNLLVFYRISVVLLVTLLVFPIQFLLVPSARAAACPGAFDADETFLGRSSEQLLAAKGSRFVAFDYTGPSRWLPYNLRYSKKLKYGASARQSRNFMVYDNTYFSLSDTRQVVGYAHLVSNSPRRLPTVQRVHSWAATAEWEEVLLVRKGMVSSVLASLACDNLRIMIFADCYNVQITDPKTLNRKMVPPQNLGECRYRGLFLEQKDLSTPTPGLSYPAFIFSKFGMTIMPKAAQSSNDLNSLQVELAKLHEKREPIQKRHEAAQTRKARVQEALEKQRQALAPRLKNVPAAKREALEKRALRSLHQRLAKHEASVAKEREALEQINARISALENQLPTAKVDDKKKVWSLATPIPLPRQNASVVAAQGKIYVISGFKRGKGLLGRVDVYDPATDRWESRHPIPNPRSRAAAAVVQGRIYVIGGEHSEKIEVYDIATDSWSSRKPLPLFKRDNAGIGFDLKKPFLVGSTIHAIDDLIYMIAGYVRIYSPASDEWRVGERIRRPRVEKASGVVDGIIYLHGGDPQRGPAMRTEVYNPVNNQITRPPRDSFLVPIKSVGCAHGRRIYLFGGHTGQRDKIMRIKYSRRPTKAVFAYDVDSKQWEKKAAMPTTRKATTCAVVGDRIFVGIAERRMDVYNPLIDR